ncbi:uncharacterized protein LOC122538791 [Frieseomelitta varia]|uniref:uncharacterized protein LOC122538791 n=1 Tax=Frieseomelitta varia TaxID=561572 RepID=UPI001CB685DE|nr:uncharacterized protein LOC122538791 [Frieseomelitta varia]
MISSFLSYDEELLNSAYANVSLIADKAWTIDKEDPFQKLNQSLSIQNYKLTAKYRENGTYRTKSVRDVIPNSRLASYGNYEYNEDRESVYKSDDNSSPVSLPNFCWTEVTEPWMLPEVEKHFAWLTSGGVARSSRELLALTLTRTSVTRIPEPDDVSKVGCGFKSHWEDYARSLRLSPTGKKARTNHHEPSKETNLIGNTPAIELTYLGLESDPSEKSDDRYECQRYTIENSMEMQLHVRVTSDAVRNLWKTGGGNARQQFLQQRMRLQCCSKLQQPCEQNSQSKERQQQFYYAVQYRPVILRTEYQAARTEAHGVRKHLPPALSPEVPEFFPKVPVMRYSSSKEQNANRVQYFPSLNERSYQNELFPYNRTYENSTGAIYQSTGVPLLSATDTTTTFIRPPQQWYQRVPPPPAQIQIPGSSSNPIGCTSVQPLRTTTITHHPLQVQEKFLQSNPIPIPVYQHPIELYHETGQKRKNQGVDFKNLILLTRNAMKAHRGQSKSSQQKPSYLEGKNRSTKTESEVLQWLDKSRPPKTKEFNALATELRNYDGRSDRKTCISRREKDGGRTSERMKSEVQGSISERDKNDTRNRRRLYRDVLTNASANQASLENVFEKRYDELEQQAMEQYRTSEESLALKYQELERQAMEQYKCCGGNAQEEGPVSRALTDDKKIRESFKQNFKEENCYDGQKCPGFGKCSPMNTEKKEGDNFLENQDNLAQTESTNESDVPGRCLSDKNRRSNTLSRNLTTLPEELSHESKNTAKGASGDEINRSVSVRASSKRRLILVSPFEKESEAKLTRSTDLEEFYCITQANKNIFGYYNNSKVGQIGGGDENITIIQSPRTEGTGHFWGYEMEMVYSRLF